MNSPAQFDTIPNAKMGQIISLVETLQILGGKCDKAGIAFALDIKEANVYAPIRAADILNLVITEDQMVIISDLGEKFVSGQESDRKDIICKQLKIIEPFATIVRALDNRPLSEVEVINFIRAKLPSARNWKDSTLTEMFRTIRGWCEFGNILNYDSDTKTYTRGNQC